MKKNTIQHNRQQISQALYEIDQLLESGTADLAIDRYIHLVNILEESTYESDSNMKADVYSSFAFSLFGMSQYEYFFEMLIKAQNHGYSQEKIEEILMAAFIEPNLQEYQAVYEANIQFLQSNGFLSMTKNIPVEELPYWLLPTGNADEYYLYHKENKQILEKIVLFKFIDIQPVPPSDAFADYLIVENWSWTNILTCTNTIKKENKKAYIVVKEIEKWLSCLQGALLNKDILSNVMIFDSYDGANNYFKQSNAYLPRNIVDLADDANNPQLLIDNIHAYRLDKANRAGDRVLLSICIPSFNRGSRAYDNIKHLMGTYYDEEIEFIISNNGTENETMDFYAKIGQLDDARLKYFAFDKNQGFAINCSKVIDMAEGKFVLLVSDEDLVNLDVLDQIMNMLNKSTETIALMRTSSTTQSRQLDNTAAAGEPALLKYMLTSNYMSGIIYNNEILKKHKGTEFVKENLDNSVCYWYPHMFWELLVCQFGVALGTSINLIQEGAVEEADYENISIGDGSISIPYYASVKGRLEQYSDFLKLFKNLEICNPLLLRKMHIILCAKTLFLVKISIKKYYNKTDTNPLAILENSYKYIIDKDEYRLKISDNPKSYFEDLVYIEKRYNDLKHEIMSLSNV
ncbi:Glycosyl transferase family 2 [Paenibacillus algorifonticola]|uniref:Glycosyl transferase family 2 n=1 Tax=Paenibacillus algorifonticola TaxID=684063 RepID=A0A1I2DJB8_9BACL|nr:glycosyltransferase [Paenibacillus algorifonticola]SFE80557.1 Glycosyl transferase family 2 [Paenibacillus algorifonticola]